MFHLTLAVGRDLNKFLHALLVAVVVRGGGVLFACHHGEIPLFPHLAHDLLGDIFCMKGIHPEKELDGRVLEGLKGDLLLYSHVVELVFLRGFLLLLVELHDV